ncbi:hypothetical protein HA402_015243 [Bradysia odoriphaga]|nr:hypothetical protein HA402_015243 [Bradysia odoriphaga]
MDDDLDQKSTPQPHPKKLKILTTIAIYFGNITLGYGMNTLAPAIEDIRARYDASIDEISIVFTVGSISYCMGALAYGFVSKCLNRQILVLAALAGMTFALYMFPHCPTKLVFFVVGGVFGFSAGLYDTSQVVWIIEIWQAKAGPFILAQHFFYALGSNIPSILIAPFLIDANSSTGKGSESRIYVPFTILGAIATLAFLCQALLFAFYRYYTPPIYANEIDNLVPADKTVSQEPSTETAEIAKSDLSTIFGWNKRKIQLIAITGMFIGTYQGMEMCTFNFIPIFGQYSNLKMTESASAYVLTSLTATFAIGRGIGIILILKVLPEFILFANLALVLIGNVILLVWASDNQTMFWIGCIIMGTGYSTMYPGFCAFMEKHLVFTDDIGSFMVVLGSTFAAIYPLIVGKLIEQKAVVLTYTNFFSSVACVAALTWGLLIVRKAKKRV